MEQEIVVVKKKRKHLGLALATVVAAYIISVVVNRYAFNTIVRNVTDGVNDKDDFTIYHLLFMASCIAMLLLIVNGINLLVRLFDKEQILSVRKSSLENKKAQAYLKNMKKKARLVGWINDILFAVLIGFASLYYIRTGNESDYMYAIIIFILIFMFNPTRILFSVFSNDKDDIMLDECDPVSYLALIELASVEATKLVKYNYPLLIRIAACYYIGDYEEMFKLLDKYEARKIKVHEGINALYYRGAAFINMGNSGGFNYISSKLSNIEKNIRLSDSERALVKSVRTMWQILIGISGTNPLSVKELVLNEMKKNEKMLFRIELTYYLSLIQLASGDEETAILNLKYVAQNGGTTVFCSKAKQLLISRDIDVSGYQSDLSFE